MAPCPPLLTPQADSSVRPVEPGRRRRLEFLALGLIAAFAALAGRLLLIRDFGTALPYQDQWRLIAIDVLQPWLNGTLSVSSFFQSANDHLNTLGRLYSFSLVLANGQWNNLLEITLNAVLHGLTILLLVITVAPALSRFAAVVLALVAGLVAGLPYSWENSLFGAQINPILEVGFSLGYMRAMIFAKDRSLEWWLGQAAALLVLLTQRSGVLVLAPVAGLHLWRLWHGTGSRRAHVAGLLFVGLWSALFLLIAPPFEVTATMKAGTWRIVLDTILRQLGWPLPHPGWSLLIYLPLVWLVLDRLGRRCMSHPEVFLVLVGLWVAAHAAAIGYARGGVTTGFVSRYTDFLSFGYLANAACLMLLWQSLTGFRAKAWLALLSAAWIGFSCGGLWQESVSGHAGYNLERRLVINQHNLTAVRTYVTSGDPLPLAADHIRVSLYPHPPALVELLAHPRFRALLPPETGAIEARTDYGRLGSHLGTILRFGPGFCAAMAVLLSLLVLLPWRRRELPAAALPPSHWTSSQAVLTGTVAALLVWGALLAWEQPFHFDPKARWQTFLSTGATGGNPLPLSFTSTVGRPVKPRELPGAVTTEPMQIRPFLHGTLLPDATYTGIVCSPPFTVDRRFAFVLLTGWPNWPGNAVRWQVENPATGEKSWIAALGLPNGPGNGVRLWTESMEPYRGWRVQLFLFDGTTDERGWVGLSEPVLSDDPTFGPRWLAHLEGERAESSHHVIAALAGLLSLMGLTMMLRHWLSARATTAA